MVEFLQESGLPFAIALTKSDKLSKQQAIRQKAQIKKKLGLGAETQIVTTSAEKGTGIDELRQVINEALSENV
jgi:GTP-binding protein